MEDFNQVFKSPEAKEMGLKLQTLIESCFDDIEAGIVGGSKVKLVLYSRNGKNNVLCGIQEGSKASCMLYVHHIDEINHKRLKFSGKGKHARRIKFNDINEIIEDDIRWLMSKVNENAPY
jgi:hypothetical protein